MNHGCVLRLQNGRCGGGTSSTSGFPADLSWALERIQGRSTTIPENFVKNYGKNLRPDFEGCDLCVRGCDLCVEFYCTDAVVTPLVQHEGFRVCSWGPRVSLILCPTVVGLPEACRSGGPTSVNQFFGAKRVQGCGPLTRPRTPSRVSPLLWSQTCSMSGPQMGPGPRPRTPPPLTCPRPP